MTPNQIIDQLFDQLSHIHKARRDISTGEQLLEHHLEWFHKFFFMLIEELEKKYPEVSIDEVKRLLDERIKKSPFTWDKK